MNEICNIAKLNNPCKVGGRLVYLGIKVVIWRRSVIDNCSRKSERSSEYCVFYKISFLLYKIFKWVMK